MYVLCVSDLSSNRFTACRILASTLPAVFVKVIPNKRLYSHFAIPGLWKPLPAIHWPGRPGVIDLETKSDVFRVSAEQAFLP